MSIARAYTTAVAATYVPLAAAALLTWLAGHSPTPAPKLSFVADWNVAFMFLVSFPTLFALTVSDQRCLDAALTQVSRDGVLDVAMGAASRLRASWDRRHRRLNLAGYVVGVVVGIALAVLNYKAYSMPTVGYWIASNGTLLPVGYVFLYAIFVYYALVPIYVFRTVATSLFLKDLVTVASLRMLPFHPDRCGGLRPVGELGLRNQYALTVFGLNLVSLVVLSTMYLNIPRLLYFLMAAAGVAYFVLGPFVFVSPLLPFRAGMLRTKADLMGEVAGRLRRELQRLRAQLSSGPITAEDEALIDRLRKLGSVVDELPVWPFDAATLKRFLVAYVVPAVTALAYPAVVALAKQVLPAYTP